jgi:phospholipid/cholesterol/gamma-HCH transport system substrate-binding protein
MSIRLLPLLAILAAACFGLYQLAKPADDKYVVNATFTDAGGILKNYNVKIGQIAAGTIERVELTKDDKVHVRMELDEGAAPIGDGATAKVRPVNLLGEKYVDLDPGDVDNPLPSGSTIPESRTGVPVELDDVLNTLDPDTRAGLRILINEAGTALAGRGADFNETLTDLPPAIDEARKVVGEIAAENQNLETAIVGGDRVINEIYGHRDDLGEFVDSAGDALATVADRRADLGATVRSAPAGFDRLRGTLARLEGATDQLSPAAEDLQRTAPVLASTLERLPAFADDAQVALAAIRETSPTLERLGAQSTPTLRRIRPTAGRLASFATSLQPLMKSLGPDGGFRAFLGFIDGWAGVTNQADGLGHVFNLRLTVDEEILTSAIQKYTETLLPDAQKRGKPSRPAPVQAGAAHPTPVDALKQPLKDTLDGVGKTVQDTLAGVDKTVKDTQTLLDQLLKQGVIKGAGAPQPGADPTDLLNYLLAP